MKSGSSTTIIMLALLLIISMFATMSLADELLYPASPQSEALMLSIGLDYNLFVNPNDHYNITLSTKGLELQGEIIYMSLKTEVYDPATEKSTIQSLDITLRPTNNHSINLSDVVFPSPPAGSPPQFNYIIFTVRGRVTQPNDVAVQAIVVSLTDPSKTDSSAWIPQVTYKSLSLAVDLLPGYDDVTHRNYERFVYKLSNLGPEFKTGTWIGFNDLTPNGNQGILDKIIQGKPDGCSINGYPVEVTTAKLKIRSEMDVDDVEKVIGAIGLGSWTFTCDNLAFFRPRPQARDLFFANVLFSTGDRDEDAYVGSVFVTRK